MSSYEEKLCEAMEYIADKAVQNASYDKTIQASVIRCEDELLGQYKVRYQDSTFYAYAANTEITYSPKTLVYVLVPGNDMGNTKTILGTVKKLGSDYITLVETGYELVGIDCILSEEEYGLCSYKETQNLVIYDKTLGEENKIIIDNVGAREYFKDLTAVECKAKFRTALPSEQQYRGEYRVVYYLDFYDNATGSVVTREYILGINNIEGEPYKLGGGKEQANDYELDGANFIEISKIEIQCEGFPIKDLEGEHPNDIFISNLGITGIRMISQELLNTQCLTILTPEGYIFLNEHLDSEEKILQAQLRVKGKVINSNLSTIKYYWFIENAKVTRYDDRYNEYGGGGWACLNEYTAEENGQRDWKPGKYQLKVNKGNNPAQVTRYKCVAIYNGLILSRIQEIKNYSSKINVEIVSDSGNQFYYDNGTPTLTCLVNREEKLNYTYTWASIDNNNNYEALENTEEDNSEYNTAVEKYNALMGEISAGTKLAAVSQEELNSYLTIIEKYDKIQRVESNKIHKIQMNEIINFKTFKCSVYNEEGLYLGTAEIILTNSLQKKDEYKLIINNGTQVFKYNEAGVSPASPSLVKPVVIQPLSFTLFDPAGVEVDIAAIDLNQVQWLVPQEDTMLTIPTNQYGEPTVVDGKGAYYNIAEFNYGIANRFGIDKDDNNIQLIINYKDVLLSAETNFSFIKEGEPGTNGTEIVCKIVANDINSDNSIQPMIIRGNLNYTVKGDSKQWFKVQLWDNGEKIFEGASSNDNVTVRWSILKNPYSNVLSNPNTGSNATDESSIILANEDNGYFTYKKDQLSKGPANIVKCIVAYNGMDYYALMPVIIVENSTAEYTVELKEGTGFKNVLYTTDGQNPSYSDEEPFELIVKVPVNKIIENVTTTSNNVYGVNYSWSTISTTKEKNGTSWQIVEKNLLTLKEVANEPHKIFVKPSKTYDGECVNTALICMITKKENNALVGTIHIPIHMSLNRYGNAAINGWDGNSVSIDKDGNGVILAPQVGAGKKEDDNSFTGVLMGEVKEGGRTTKDVGLFGYANGVRTIFLDAETGMATFGKNGGGQIILDPSLNKAQIKSGDYKTSIGDTAGAGMLIDLTEPSIRFGNGNFSVNSEGYLISRKGTIGGWNIDSDVLYGGSGNNQVGMSSNSSKYAFFAGSNNNTGKDAKFRVGHDGKMVATDGTIGGWTIGDTSLISNNGNTKLWNNGSMEGTNWKIDSNGKAYFYDVQITNNAPSYADNTKLLDFGNFYVQKNGYMQSSSGLIGNWQISEGSLISTGGGGYIRGGTVSGSSITGGSIDITTSGGGYLRAGKTTHPEVSALNVRDSIVIKDHAIGYGNNPGGNAFYAQSNFAVNGWYKVVNENGEHTGSTLNNQNVCIGITVDSSGKVTQTRWVGLTFIRGILTSVGDVQTFNH